MTEIMFYRGPFVIQVPSMERPNTGGILGAEFSTGMYGRSSVHRQWAIQSFNSGVWVLYAGD